MSCEHDAGGFTLCPQFLCIYIGLMLQFADHAELCKILNLNVLS